MVNVKFLFLSKTIIGCNRDTEPKLAILWAPLVALHEVDLTVTNLTDEGVFWIYICAAQIRDVGFFSSFLHLLRHLVHSLRQRKFN